MAVGLTLTDRAKDHKTLVLGLLLVKLEGDFLGAIVCKAKRLAINVCVRPRTRRAVVDASISNSTDSPVLVDEKVIRLLSSD